MSAAPPAYNAADAPPAYHEAIGKLSNLLGETKSPSEVINAASNLSEDELLLIAKYSDPVVLETDEQKRKFSMGVKQTISSSHEVSEEDLEQSASKTAQAAVDIDLLFTKLHNRLTEIDDLHKSPEGGFAKRVKASQQKYRDILQESQALSIEVAVHGEAFDEQVVKLCADRKLSIERRKERIENWIQHTEKITERMKQQKEHFTSLKDDISKLVEHYSNWAKSRFEEIEGRIEVIKTEIEVLDKELNSLLKWLLGVVVGATAGLLGVALLGIVFPPAVIIGGLIVAGASITAAASILVMYFDKAKKRRQLASEKDQLEEEKAKLLSIRNQLKNIAEMTDSDVALLHANISVLEVSWANATLDAIEIQQWLHNGADTVDLPSYMEQNLKHGVTTYKKLAFLFRNYGQNTKVSQLQRS